MPNEQDGKLKFGRSYVYLDPDSLESTPDAATPGVWRVKSGVDNSGDPTVGLVNAVNTRTGNVTLTSSDVGLANVNNTSDANKPVSSAQQTALNAKIDTTTANSTLLGITAKAADSELLDGLNSTSFVQTNTQFGGDVSGTYNAIVIADDSHNHVISNVDGLQSTLNVKADLVGGLVPTNQIPAIAITEYLGSVSSQTALLALSGQKGDWAIRSDTSTTWIITGTTPSDITSWTELQYPAAPVSSVNGATGTVVLGHSDVGAASTSQGSTADSAIQPGDNISQLTNNSGFISATLTDEEVQDIVGGMVSGNTENGITVTYQDTDGTIDFDVATQSDNNFTTVLKNKLDAIEVSATADQTASEIITSLLTVDGANSGLDSDLLDGQHGSYYLDYTNFTNTPTFENANKLDNLDSTQFLRSDAADIKTSGNLKFNDNIKLTFGSNDDLEISHNQTHNIIQSLNGSISLQAPAGSEIQFSQGGTFEHGVRFIAGSFVALYYNGSKKFETTNSGATVTGTLTATAFSGAGGSITGVNASQLNSQNAAYYLDYSNFSNTPTIPTNNNQLTNGAGYLTSPDGGDAITLDGLDSTDFLRSNADDTFTGELTVSGNLLLSDQVRIGNDAWIEDFDGANAIRVKGNTDSTQGYIAFGNRTEKLGCNNSATLSYDGNTIWNAGNDGSGSGLDADTVDGLNAKVSSTASSIAVRDSSSDISLRTIKSTFADETTISGAVGYRVNNSTDNSLRFCSDMSAVRTHMGTNNASNLTTGTIPIARISGGAGTGLDADLLDGVQGSSYLRSDAADGFSGVLTGTAPIAFNGTLATFDPPSSGTGADTATDVALGLGSGHRIAGHSGGYIRTLLEWNSSSDITIGQGNTSLIAGINLTPGSSGTAKVNGNTIWHAGNDGAASGLDADLLDGQHGAYYLDYNNLTNLPAGSGNTSISTGNSKAEIIDTGTDGRFIVTTEGSERLRIDSSGKVGIGTSSPSSKLHLEDSNNTVITLGNTSYDNGVIQYYNGSVALKTGASSGDRTFQVHTAGSERMRIDSAGNVGIGDSAPNGNYGTNLSVHSTATNGARVKISDGTTGKGNTDGLDIISTGGAAYFINRENSFMSFTTNSIEGLRIDSSGNVGIGTSSPNFSSFGSSTGGIEVSGVNTSNALKVAAGAVENYFTANPSANYIWSPSNVPFVIGVNATERMRIDSSGNVGIGTSSPDTQLEVVSNQSTGISSKSNNTQGTDTNKALKVRNNSTTDTFSVSYRGQGYFAGKVGIGTSSPSSYYAADLVVSGSAEGGITIDGPTTGQSYLAFADGTSGNARYRGYIAYDHATDSLKFASGASERLKIDSSGVVTIGGNTAWHAGNDSAGSGLDADTVDGIQGTSITQALARFTGWVPTYSTSDESTVTWNYTENTVEIKDPSGDNSVGAAYKAIKLKAGQKARINVQVKGSVADTDGVYLRLYFYNGTSLPNGKTHVSHNATHPLVQEDSANDTGWHENGSISTSYVSYSHDYTAGADGYLSLVILNWTGYSGSIYVKEPVISIENNWHAGNDGSGSGLDADTLDGYQISKFVYDRGGSQITTNTNWNNKAEPGMYGVASSSAFTGTNNPGISGIYTYGVLSVFEANGQGITQLYTPHTGNKIAIRTGWNNGGWYGWQQVWTSTSDGSGSGLDADTLDGQQGSHYLNYNNLTNKPAAGMTTGKGIVLSMIFG